MRPTLAALGVTPYNLQNLGSEGPELSVAGIGRSQQELGRPDTLNGTRVDASELELVVRSTTAQLLGYGGFVVNASDQLSFTGCAVIDPFTARNHQLRRCSTTARCPLTLNAQACVLIMSQAPGVLLLNRLRPHRTSIQLQVKGVDLFGFKFDFTRSRCFRPRPASETICPPSVSGLTLKPTLQKANAGGQGGSLISLSLTMWRLLAVTIAAALASLTGINPVEASAQLRRRQAAENTLFSEYIPFTQDRPLASQEVYNLLPDACKPLLVSYTGTYATQEDLGKCFALVKKAPIGQDAYLFVRNHTDLIATLPWQESEAKVSFNTTLSRLNIVAGRADTFPSNGLQGFINTMNQYLHPASNPTQVRLSSRVLQNPPSYIMIQPFALASRAGKGEVFVAALTPDVLDRSNLNGKETIRFFNARSPSADVESYVGWVVDLINGKPPHDVAQSVSTALGPDHGHNAFVSTYLESKRFNDEPTGQENVTLGIRPGTLSFVDSGYQVDAFYQNPVTYVIRNPSTNTSVTHTFPWIVWPLQGLEYSLGENLLYALDISRPFPTQKAIAGATGGNSTIARRQINSKYQPRSHAEVSRAVSFLFPPAAAQLGPNVYRVNQETLAVTLFHPKGSRNDYLAYNYSTVETRGTFAMQDYISFFDRFDKALESAVKSNQNIKNVILDLTEWNIDNEMLAMAYYFFGSTVKPLEYAFRLTPLVRAILKGFFGAVDGENAQYGNEYQIHALNITQHLSPSTRLSSVNREFFGRPRFPGSVIDITAQAKNITVNGSPVPISGRFVPANVFAAAAVIQPAMSALPQLAEQTGKPNGAYFDPSSLTILTHADTCTGKCEEFVRIARSQFKVRTVTLGNRGNGFVSAPTTGTYNASVPTLTSMYRQDFFSTFVEQSLAAVNRGSKPNTGNAPEKLLPIYDAATEVAKLMPAGFSLRPFLFSGSNLTRPRTDLGVPLCLVYDAEAPDDAVPLGVMDSPEADVTLKDVWRFDWPMGVWRVVANLTAQNVATQKPSPPVPVAWNSTWENGTVAVTTNITTVTAPAKSSGYALRVWVGGLVGLVGFVALTVA
ncbi:hypothetical protein HDU96_006821 [Phlyctochytrium bullatum]|nr:hypothetical protein HDU96_006821 [Phlyctochytrium bullatum]